MVTIVKSLVGTGVNYAQAQIRTRSYNGIRLQIPTGGGSCVELDFDVDSTTHNKIYSLLEEATKPVPVAPQVPCSVIALTLEQRVANIEGFLSTHIAVISQ